MVWFKEPTEPVSEWPTLPVSPNLHRICSKITKSMQNHMTVYKKNNGKLNKINSHFDIHDIRCI